MFEAGFYFPNDLNILLMQRFFCSMFGWTYRSKVVEILNGILSTSLSLRIELSEFFG